MRVIIVGANFVNKGAQSMLFITVDEIKKRFPKCEIYYSGAEHWDNDVYAFNQVYRTPESVNIALKRKLLVSYTRCVVKDIIKFIIGRRNNLWRFNELKNLLPETDLIIDISGFNIGKKWSSVVQEAYLDNIRMAKLYSIPVVMMPQSFGPFDYSTEKMYLLKEINDLLPYATKIYAREKESYQMLVDTFALPNVELSTDLVLQNKGINIENIYTRSQESKIPAIETNSVGIIPNTQCFNHGNKQQIINIYSQIIKKLLDLGKNIYIFRHSFEDMEVCSEIYNAVSQFNSGNIHIIKNDFSCIEYDHFVKLFDFIICSRYHGIVHAYRNHVPCILLGWANKYEELATMLCQETYVFDITSSHLSIASIEDAVDKMCSNYTNESQIIGSQLAIIQKENCFCILDNVVK